MTECANRERQAFGLTRLEDVVGQTPIGTIESSMESIERSLRAWRESGEFADDVTLLGLERRAA